jgi:hypothetical protein
MIEAGLRAKAITRQMLDLTEAAVSSRSKTGSKASLGVGQKKTDE